MCHKQNCCHNQGTLLCKLIGHIQPGLLKAIGSSAILTKFYSVIVLLKNLDHNLVCFTPLDVCDQEWQTRRDDLISLAFAFSIVSFIIATFAIVAVVLAAMYISRSKLLNVETIELKEQKVCCIAIYIKLIVTK